MDRSSERFGADQDIQSKFIKKSTFHINIGADIIKHLAQYSVKSVSSKEYEMGCWYSPVLWVEVRGSRRLKGTGGEQIW